MIFMIVNCLLLLTIACGQTTPLPQLLHKVAENAKNKRGLQYYEDTLIGPPPPPQQVNSLAYIPSTSRPLPGPAKWTNVFGFDDITYQHIYDELNGFGSQIPTHMTPPPLESPSIWSNGYGYVNYGATNELDTAYIAHDGRIVKQYAVHERHHNDLPEPVTYQRARPVFMVRTVPSFIPNNLNFAQPRTLNVNPSPSVPTFLNKNHGPVALGSGSLGVVRLPNGDVFLGSGSLGYVSHKDHYDNVIETLNRRQQPFPRGPTSFGS